MDREGFSEKVTFKGRPEGREEGVSPVDTEMNNLGKYSSKCKGSETESVVIEKQCKDQWGQSVVSNRGIGGEEVRGSQTPGCVGPATTCFPFPSSKYLSATSPSLDTNLCNPPPQRPSSAFRPLLTSLAAATAEVPS